MFWGLEGDKKREGERERKEKRRRRRRRGEGGGSCKGSHILLPPALANLSIYSSILPAGGVNGFYPETTVIIPAIKQFGFVAYCNKENPHPGEPWKSLIIKVLRMTCHRILG